MRRRGERGGHQGGGQEAPFKSMPLWTHFLQQLIIWFTPPPNGPLNYKPLRDLNHTELSWSSTPAKLHLVTSSAAPQTQITTL